jgi:hypothetical protein
MHTQCSNEQGVSRSNNARNTNTRFSDYRLKLEVIHMRGFNVFVCAVGYLAAVDLTVAETPAAPVSNEVRMETEMSFIVAGCVLLLAVIAGVIFDDARITRWQAHQRENADGRYPMLPFLK